MPLIILSILLSLSSKSIQLYVFSRNEKSNRIRGKTGNCKLTIILSIFIWRKNLSDWQEIKKLVSNRGRG